MRTVNTPDTSNGPETQEKQHTPDTIKVNGFEYRIYVSGTGSEVSVITVPQSITLQDSIEEMIEDIGEFDIEYLREVYADNATFSVQ